MTGKSAAVSRQRPQWDRFDSASPAGISSGCGHLGHPVPSLSLVLRHRSMRRSPQWARPPCCLGRRRGRGATGSRRG
eukprot:9262707-Pyramimonas_sp.AAC.1